jgi:hypothetical protein
MDSPMGRGEVGGGERSAAHAKDGAPFVLPSAIAPNGNDGGH